MSLYQCQLTQLDLSEIKRYAGLQTSDFSAERLQAAADSIILTAQPRATWQLYAYDSATATVQATKPYHLPGRSISRHLAGAEQIIFVAVTIGEAAEAAITRQFQQGEYTAAVLMDAAATTAVETVADQLERTLRAQFNPQGYKLTPRFSPGYGDWALTEQQTVLPLTGGNTLGITLTEAFMLLPRKSITAVIGLIPNTGSPAKKTVSAGSCSTCQKTDCPARKHPVQP